MTVSIGFNTVSLRKCASPVYVAKITATGGPGVGGITKTLYLSDHDLEYENSYQIRGLVSRWMTFEWGRGTIGGSSYAIADAQITLTPDLFGGMDVGETSLVAWRDFYEFMRWWPLRGATLEVYLTFSDLKQPITNWSQRFEGRIYKVQDVSPTGVSLRARADHVFDTIANPPLYRGEHEDIRPSDDGGSPPVIGGVVGFDRDRHFLLGRSNTSAISSDVTNWWRAGLNWGAVPYGRMTDSKAQEGENFTIKMAANSFENTAAPGGGRIVVSWPGISNVLCPLWRLQESGSTYYPAGDDTTITLPSEDAAAFGAADYVKDGDVIIVAAHYPTPDPKYLSSSAKGKWVGSENICDPTSFTKATATAANALFALGYEGNQFIIPPTGDNYSTALLPADTDHLGAFALIYVHPPASDNITIQVGYNDGSAQTQASSVSYAAGYHWVWMALNSTPASYIMHGDWGSSGADDHIRIKSDGTSTPLDVYLLGIAATWAPTQQSIHDESSSVRFFFQGNGNNSAISDYSPGEVLAQTTLDASDGGILVPDWYTSATIPGGLSYYRTEINASVAANTSNDATTAKLGLGLTDESTLRDIIEVVQQDTFSRVWKNPRTGMYNIRLKRQAPAYNTDYSGNTLTLRPEHLWQSSPIRLSTMDDSEVKNAIIIDYHYDAFKGRYLRRVKIDNSTNGSEDYMGNTSASYESAADDAQDEFGKRNELHIRSKIISCPATAWDACVRMFQVLAYPRPVVRFVCDYWGLQLNMASVFKISNDMEDVLTWPGPVSWLGLSDWDDGRWWVTRIRETVYGGIEVEAVDLETI